MSGGSGVVGGGPEIDQFPCDALRFDAQLTSPQPAVVAQIRVGDDLEVDVVTMNAQRIVRVVKNSAVAGGLAGPDATRLRQCMEAGHAYRATALSINGGQVRVRVEHR
jgi:hypothetical protein